MYNIRQFLSRRFLLTFLGVAVLLVGLAMLHPYPRQSLFGPTIRGKPWCVWESAVRRHVNRAEYEQTLHAKIMRSLGIAAADMDQAELFDHPEMMPLLLHLLDDPDPAVRQGVTSSFFWHGKLQNKSAVPSLRARLDDDDPRCRIEAAMALTQIEPGERNVRVLVKILDDSASDARYTAIHAMSFMVNDAIFDTFVGYAKDADPAIRKEVMFTLPRFAMKGVPILVQGLNDPILSVRLDAAEALGTIGADAKEAIPALERRLNDADRSVRAAAATALTAIDPLRFRHLNAE